MSLECLADAAMKAEQLERENNKRKKSIYKKNRHNAYTCHNYITYALFNNQKVQVNMTGSTRHITARGVIFYKLNDQWCLLLSELNNHNFPMFELCHISNVL